MARDVPDSVDDEPGFMAGFVSATTAVLTDLGKLDTMLGQQVLIIARGMARGSGSELATLSKEHSRLMAEIESGKTIAADPVEEAAAKRAEKLARAATA